MPITTPQKFLIRAGCRQGPALPVRRPLYFTLSTNGQLQAFYANSAGFWYAQTLLTASGSPALVTLMGAELVGPKAEQGYVFGLDATNNLWAGSAISMAGDWTWQNLSAVAGGQPLLKPMGAGEVSGLASMFGLDGTGNFWACQNRGGQWAWANLSAQQDGTALDASVAFVSAGFNAAIVGIGYNNDLWACVSFSGNWSWGLCGSTPAATTARLATGQSDEAIWS